MNKIHLYDKIISPLVTEKSTNLSEQNKIVFKVPYKANKKNIIDKITDYMENYSKYISLMNKQKAKLHAEFFHGKNLYDAVAESIIK